MWLYYTMMVFIYIFLPYNESFVIVYYMILLTLYFLLRFMLHFPPLDLVMLYFLLRMSLVWLSYPMMVFTWGASDKCHLDWRMMDLLQARGTFNLITEFRGHHYKLLFKINRAVLCSWGRYQNGESIRRLYVYFMNPIILRHYLFWMILWFGALWNKYNIFSH